MRPTNERWPQYGFRINPLYPYVEGEIRYAVHHEYAQTAIDFLSRRSRLSFLNSSAALDSLPKVIEIMGDELGWSRRRRREEHNRATNELLSMGIQPSQLEPPQIGWKQWLLNGFGASGSSPGRSTGTAPSRAIFSREEVDVLKGLFAHRAGNESGSISKADIHALVKDTKGFESVKTKEVDYVLREAGLRDRTSFDCNEFLEVRWASLYDVQH
jgi:glycerol-3-phosphate dehydrogenase